MWDAISGRVFLQTVPFKPINVGPYGVNTGGTRVEYKGDQYKLDSSLLIVEGVHRGPIPLFNTRTIAGPAIAFVWCERSL
jgi:hypothetical protein